MTVIGSERIGALIGLQGGRGCGYQADGVWSARGLIGDGAKALLELADPAADCEAQVDLLEHLGPEYLVTQHRERDRDHGDWFDMPKTFRIGYDTFDGAMLEEARHILIGAEQDGQALAGDHPAVSAVDKDKAAELVDLVARLAAGVHDGGPWQSGFPLTMSERCPPNG